MTDVVIVGAGPAGLLLACELRLADVAVIVIERQRRRPGYCRGFNLNARALDLLARRGLAAGLIEEGWQVPHAAFSGLPVTLTLGGARTDHPFSLGIPQTRVEEVLEARALDLGADLRRGHELRYLQQDPGSVTATVATADGEYRLQAQYLVGCDGGRSTVRRQAGIDFPGTEATRFALLGDVELADPEALPFGATIGPGGRVAVIPRPGYVRIITADRRPPADRDDRRQRRPRRRVQPRLEARRHRARHRAAAPTRRLPHRAPPGGRPHPGQHPGPGAARRRRRPAQAARRPADARRQSP